MNTKKSQIESTQKSKNTKTESTNCLPSCSKKSVSSATVTVIVPIRLRSEANIQEHWSKKHKRKKEIQKAILSHLATISKPDLPVTITFTRIAPRSLDSADNLGMSLKSSIDCFCNWLIPGLRPGFADNDERIEIKTDQKKGKPKEYSLKVEMLSHIDD